MAFWETLATWGVISLHDRSIENRAMADLEAYRNAQGDGLATDAIFRELWDGENRKKAITEAYGYQPGTWEFTLELSKVNQKNDVVNTRKLVRKLCEKRGIKYYNTEEDPGYQDALKECGKKMSKRWFK